MSKIRKAVIPAAGPATSSHSALQFYLPASARLWQAGSNMPHGAMFGGRADFKVNTYMEVYNE